MLDIADYLLLKGARVNKPNANGETALFFAKSVEAVHLLLRYGAKVDVRNKVKIFNIQNGVIPYFYKDFRSIILHRM